MDLSGGKTMKKTSLLFLICLMIQLLGGCSTALPTKEASLPSASIPETERLTPSTAPSATEDSSSGKAVISLGGHPVKTLYLAGEFFDPTGLYGIISSPEQDSEQIRTDIVCPQEALTAGTKEVTLSLEDRQFSVPVTVLEGAGATFTSRTTAKEEEASLERFLSGSDSRVLPNRDAEPFAVLNALPNPCPDGHVTSRDALAAYVDYHVFYGISSVVVWLDYPYTDIEEELNDLYLRSSLVAGTAALSVHDPGTGPLQILLRYYRDLLLEPRREDLKQSFCTPFRKLSSRSAYQSDRVRDDGLTVFTSDQAVYALTKGYDITPVPGSPAEEIIRRAGEVLTQYGDESWSDMERLYHILLFFLDHVSYDHPGEGIAGRVPDPEREPDLLVARLTSFRAEGPLLYGSAACYGFAKAAALLLSLEGYELTRVLAKEPGVPGRSICETTLIGTYGDVIGMHSYLYVKMDGKDCLFDPTYSYAGTLSFGADEAAWFRAPCLSLSLSEHREVYTTLLPDLYGSSEAYEPGSGVRLKELLLAEGTSMLLQSREDLDHFWEALAGEIQDSGSPYAAAVAIVSTSLMSRREIQEEAYRFCARFGTYYYVHVGQHSYGGEKYHTVLLGLRQDP